MTGSESVPDRIEERKNRMQKSDSPVPQEHGKKNSIRKRIFRSIVAFVLQIVTAVSVTVCCGFLVLSRSHFVDDSFENARIIALSVNGDRIAEYLTTGEKDTTYERTDRYLRHIVKETDLNRISVLFPDEEGLVCLWDTGNDEGAETLKDRELYSDDNQKNLILNAFHNNSDISARFRREGNQEILTVYYPILTSSGEPAGIVSAEQDMPKIGNILAQFVLGIVLISALISGVMMFITYRVIEKRVIEPLDILTDSTEKMVGNLENDEDDRIDIHTGDEFETLAETFTRMDVDLRKYIDRLAHVTAEKERIDTELEMASETQVGFLPKLEPPFSSSNAFDLYVSMSPAREVGGDFYDFFMPDDSHIALVIADVSGKGMSAALFMVVAKTLIRNSFNGTLSPGEAFARVNKELLANNELGFFVTAWLAVIDLKTGKGVSVNAGHENPLFRHGSGEYEYVIYAHSMPLASWEGLQFREREFTLRPGDSIFVYTDGATEAINSDKELFGEARLRENLNRYKDASSEELVSGVRTAIDQFAESEPQFDDITMLAFRYAGPDPDSDSGKKE